MARTSKKPRKRTGPSGEQSIGTSKASTRDRVLYEASRLFAHRGYYGTSTHAIAEAVGIRQPSLFHHFASKQEIMRALLSHDLDQPARRASELAEANGSPSARLYCYIRADTAHLAASPYNLIGLHRDEVLREPEFRAERRTEEQIYAAIHRLISEGVEARELRDVDRHLAQELIVGLNDNTMRLASMRNALSPLEMAEFVADFALRGLLIDPGELDRVRAEAAELQLKLPLF